MLAPDAFDPPLRAAAALVWAALLGVPFGLLDLSTRRRALLLAAVAGSTLALSLALWYWPLPALGTLAFLAGAGAAVPLARWRR